MSAPRFSHQTVALGDRVYDARDPRHVGRVCAIVNSARAIIRFDETGFKSEPTKFADLRHAQD